jgi:hypothetical protein
MRIAHCGAPEVTSAMVIGAGEQPADTVNTFFAARS